MPADKRLSFQTRVANARTKEAVESLLHDYAERLECLALPHARSREIDLQQVKKVGSAGGAGLARARVVTRPKLSLLFSSRELIAMIKPVITRYEEMYEDSNNSCLD